MLKKLYLLIPSLAATLFVSAQNTSTSPFSTSGIGEDGALPDAQFGGFGNISSLCFDSTILNTYNPASYSSLSFGQPLFSVGIASKFSTYTNTSGSYNGKTTGISNFTFGLPIGKRFGIGFGLKPFSRKGYNLTTESYVYDDSITYNYKGYGSSNLVFAGLSYAIIRSKTSTLSIGGNIGYIFGSITNERSSTFNANAPKGGIDLTSFRMKSLYYSFGAYYQQYLGVNKLNQLFISAVYTPKLKLNSFLDYELYYATNIANLSNVDTIAYVDNNRGNITFPSKQTVAVGYAFSPDLSLKTDRLNYQFLIMAEVDLMQWSSYSENFSTHVSSSFSNTFMSRLGIQFLPNIDKNKRSTGGKYFSRIKYRLGGQYGTLPISLNGTQFNSISGTLGFGFPFLSQKTNSSINFSAQYGVNSTGKTDALNEKFFSFSLGIIIAPSSYERWFKKYKLD